MCMGILNDLGSILGLNCIITRLMFIFLRLRSVLALSSFDYRFECVEPSYERKARRGQLSQESSKTSLIGPEQAIQGESNEPK